MEERHKNDRLPMRIIILGSLRFLVSLCVTGVAGAMLFAVIWNAVGTSWSGRLAGAFHFAALFFSTFWVHLGVTAFIVATAAMILRLKWFAGVAMVVGLIATLPLLWGLVITSAEASHTDSPGRLDVMSTNLLYSLEDLRPFLAQVERQSPDVLLLQEVHTDRVDIIDSDLTSEYAHCFLWPQQGAFGLAIFSRYPFVGKPRIELLSGDPKGRWEVGHAVATIDVDGFHVDLMNIHLLPPSGFNLTSAQNLMAIELAGIANEMSQSASVLGGDFNAAERALPVRRFRQKGYESVHLEAGQSLGATWPRRGRFKHVPGVRLDHVLYRGEGLRLIDQGVGEDFGSDHRPVWATFELIRQQ